MKSKMKRYWFRVMINKKESKVVKVLIQAPDYDAAVVLLKSSIEQYYPYDPDFDILNNAQDVLPDDRTYVVIADGKTSHFTSML